MPKEKDILLDIEAVYKWQTIDDLMFGYCQGIQRVAPATTDQKAIQEFMHWLHITDDNFNAESAGVKYSLMKSQFLKMKSVFPAV